MKATLTDKVRNGLLKDYVRSSYPKERSIPSEKALASRYGVSIITVRRAVETLAREGLLVKRQGSGTYVGDGRPPGAPLSFGIVVPDATTYTYSKLGMLLEPLLRGMGSQARLLVERDGERLASLLDSEGGSLDGLVVCGYVFKWRSLKRLGVPCVFAGSEDPWDADSVFFDLRSGVCDAVSHLLKLGHKKVLFISHIPLKDGKTRLIREDFKFQESPRFLGYLDALADAGIPFDERLVLRSSGAKADVMEKLKSFMARPGSPKFSAIFASMDLQAEGVIQALREQGLEVPGSVSVVGCDNLRGPDEHLFKLTTLDLRLEDVARKAVEFLLERVASPESRELRSCGLAPRLVLGDTSARPSIPAS